MKIIFAGLIEGLQRRADNSWKITFATQELSGTEVANLNEIKGFVKLLISDNNISQLQEDAIDNTLIAQTGKQKTPSQRLRSVLFVAHQQSGLEIPFEDYYKNSMESFIQTIKSKLD